MRGIDYSAVVKGRKKWRKQEGEEKRRDTEREKSKALQSSVSHREMGACNHCWWPRQPAFPSPATVPCPSSAPHGAPLLVLALEKQQAAQWLTENKTEAWPWGVASLSLRSASLTACMTSVAMWSWLGFWGGFVREEEKWISTVGYKDIEKYLCHSDGPERWETSFDTSITWDLS